MGPLLKPSDFHDKSKLFIIIQLDEGQIFQLRHIYAPWNFEGKDERSWRVEKGCLVGGGGGGDGVRKSGQVDQGGDDESDEAPDTIIPKETFSADDFLNLVEMKESFEKFGLAGKGIEKENHPSPEK